MKWDLYGEFGAFRFLGTVEAESREEAEMNVGELLSHDPVVVQAAENAGYCFLDWSEVNAQLHEENGKEM